MKRCGWLVTTFVALLLTGTALTPAGAPEARRHRPAPCGSMEDAGQAQARDPFTTAAARRWSEGQPHHWHACLLQR
jgi:hypothetical protein